MRFASNTKGYILKMQQQMVLFGILLLVAAFIVAYIVGYHAGKKAERLRRLFEQTVADEKNRKALDNAAEHAKDAQDAGRSGVDRKYDELSQSERDEIFGPGSPIS